MSSLLSSLCDEAASVSQARHDLSLVFYTTGPHPLVGFKLILVDCNRRSKEEKNQNSKYRSVPPIGRVSIVWGHFRFSVCFFHVPV